jgi:esterase
MQLMIKNLFNAQLTGNDNSSRCLFLHGLMGSLNNWRTTISKLEKTHQCLVFDQRGHGRSFKPDGGYSVNDYADDIKQILDELGWKKLCLIGHSMGGRNALRFAHLYPKYVEKLVIEDIGPEPVLGNERYYQELLSTVPTPFLNRTLARDYFKGQFQSVAKVRGSVEQVAQFLNANLEEKQDGKMSWRFSKEGILETVEKGLQLNQWVDIKGLSCPTLLIRGGNSLELPHAIYEKILLENKLIQGVTIENAGHWVHADQPEQFFIELQRFVG